MTITCRNPSLNCTNKIGRKLAKANKIYVQTKISQDGKYSEGFWLDYNTDKDGNYALFLFTEVLNLSETVEFYWIFDNEGNRIEPVVNQFNTNSKQR